MTGLSKAGSAIKSCWQDRDLVIFSDMPVGYGISLNLTAECRIKNKISLVKDVTRRTATNLTRRDKHSDRGGMAGLSQK